MSDRERMVLRVKPARCRYCQTCVLACSMHHENGRCSLQYGRLAVERDLVENKVKMTICRNCEDPKCMNDCPPGAMSIDPNGTVIIDQLKCTACGNCRDNCPFGAVIFVEGANKYLKCDLCAGRAEGPLCVDVCPVHAINLARKSNRRQ